MQKDQSPEFTIEVMRLEDVEAATDMRLQSWLDTYVNDDMGVSREWIKSRNAEQRSPETQASRRERFSKGVADGTFAAWIARDRDMVIIGSATPFVDDEGVQHVGSLYVDKRWHSSGVGAALMQKVIDWFDPTKPIELGVVSYNKRAKAFYRKWGFEEVRGSEALFADKIPEIKMIRKPKEDV
ncbi:MAG TPA: GNAT family N-acetyltransferase [Candidatus Saccharimonas sp.]|nr:GNAT family N-acetyltransferase [Candidatus Saccharimonas sp.]